MTNVKSFAEADIDEEGAQIEKGVKPFKKKGALHSGENYTEKKKAIELKANWV